MFSFSGTWYDEVVEERPVSAAELVKYFNLPIKTGQQTIFQLLPKVIKVKNGQEFYAHTRKKQPVITGVHKGQSYTIRYYTQRLMRPASNGSPAHYVYSPERVEFTGKSMVFDDEKFELAVYFCLLPECQQSPFREKYGREFSIVDRDGIAKANYDQEQFLMRVRQEIFSLSDDRAIFIGKGLVIKGERISLNLLDSGMSAKFELVKKLEKYPRDFEAIFRSQATYNDGLCQHLVDTNIIASKEVGGGIVVWYFKDTSEEIVRCKPKADIHNVLFETVREPGFMPKLAKRISGEIAKPGEENVIERAIRANVLDYDPEAKKVFILEKGIRQQKALCLIEGDDWQAEMLENLTDIQKARLLKALNQDGNS